LAATNLPSNRSSPAPGTACALALSAHQFPPSSHHHLQQQQQQPQQQPQQQQLVAVHPQHHHNLSATRPAQPQPSSHASPSPARQQQHLVEAEGPPADSRQGLLAWYCTALGKLEALLQEVDAAAAAQQAAAQQVGFTAAGQRLATAVDSLSAALHRLAADDRGVVCCTLLSTNLETGAVAAPSDAHWRSVVAQLGLTQAQRALALDVLAVYHSRGHRLDTSKEAAVQALADLLLQAPLVSDHQQPWGSYPVLCSLLHRILSSERTALLTLAAALKSVLSRTQLARWAVYSWPFFPSPVDLLAAIEEERDRAQPLLGGPARAGLPTLSHHPAGQ